MGTYVGNTLVAGATFNPTLLDFKWADHILNDVSWLRADTFSWQPGSVYEAAYNQLVEDLASSYMWQGWKVSNDASIPWVHTKSFLVSVGETVYSDHELTTAVGVISAVGTDNITVSGITYTKTSYGYNHFYETIDGITIGGYVASNGRKICTVSTMIERVEEIYNATGVAWYYILDTTNKRFKLPRSKHNRYATTLGVVGNGMAIGVTNGSNNATLAPNTGVYSAVFAAENGYGQPVGYGTNYTQWGNKAIGIVSDSSKSGIIARQQQDTDQYKYLYFYVGNFTKSAIQQTAGITTEELNGKVDVGHQVVGFQAPTAGNNYTWYRLYADGWVEQGGLSQRGSSNISVVLPVSMQNNMYFAIASRSDTNTPPDDSSSVSRGGADGITGSVYNKTTSGFTIRTNTSFARETTYYVWEVKGMAA